MSGFVWIIPILAVCALCFAAYKASYVSKAAAGTPRMQGPQRGLPVCRRLPPRLRKVQMLS